MITGFGKKLKDFRKEHHLTQKQLAEMMNISVNHVSVLEREEKLPRASTIEAFNALKVKADIEKYGGEGITEENKEDYIRLIQSLNGLDEQKKAGAITAIIQIVGLIK